MAWTGASLATYYGQRLAVILRNYIIVVEAKLGLPARSLGIGDLVSPSPARYLRIMLQITAFGAFAVYFLAGSLCGLWALRRDEIRRIENEFWPRVMAVFWTCANAATFMVKLILVTFHIRYSKMAHILDQSPSLIPLGRSADSEDQRTSKAAGSGVKPDCRTREESDLDHTLHVIETDIKQTINLQSTGIHRDNNGQHCVAASWRAIQDDVTRIDYGSKVSPNMDATQDHGAYSNWSARQRSM